MRLLLVSESRSAHTEKWAQHFADRGDEVLVLSHSDDPIAGVEVVEFPPSGSWWARLPRVRFGGGWQRWLAGWPYWRRLLREFSPDVVHLHYLSAEARDYFYYREVERLVVSTWGADVVFDEGEPGAARLRRLRSILAQADEITATTEFLKSATERLLRRPRNVHVIPFGVDCDRFRPARTELEQGREITIGFVKHLKEKYGPEFLLEAFAEVHREVPYTRLLLAGEGPLENRLRGRIEELGLDSVVELLGRIPHSRVPALMRSLDVFAMPSVFDSETFGVAAIEASASGVPVVASAVGGVPEAVIDGETGTLVPPRSVEALSQALLRLVKDSALCRRMGRAGRQFVLANFEWKTTAGMMARLYDSLIARKPPRSSR